MVFEYHTEDSKFRLHCVQIAGGDVRAAEEIYDFIMKTAKKVGETLCADEQVALAAKSGEAA